MLKMWGRNTSSAFGGEADATPEGRSVAFLTQSRHPVAQRSCSASDPEQTSLCFRE